MGLAASAKVFAAGAAWRLAGFPPAGRELVDVASTGEDQERTLAGMFLVQAGDRSVPVVADRLRSGDVSPVLFDVLASIGTDRARASLSDLAVAGPGAVAGAAAEALQQLDKIRDRRPDPS